MSKVFGITIPEDLQYVSNKSLMMLSDAMSEACRAKFLIELTGEEGDLFANLKTVIDPAVYQEAHKLLDRKTNFENSRIIKGKYGILQDSDLQYVSRETLLEIAKKLKEVPRAMFKLLLKLDSASNLKTVIDPEACHAAFSILCEREKRKTPLPQTFYSNILDGRSSEFQGILEKSGISKDIDLQYTSKATLRSLAQLLTEVKKARFIHTLNLY